MTGILQAEVPLGTRIPSGVLPWPCLHCGRAMMLSPSSRELLEPPAATQALCTDCVQLWLKLQPADANVVAILPPGAARDLEDFDKE